MEWVLKCRDGNYIWRYERHRHSTISDRKKAKVLKGSEEFAKGYRTALEFFLAEKLTLEKLNTDDHSH